MTAGENPAWPRAHGAPVLSARFRATPGDFRVDEIDAFAPSGVGEHLLLTVEKRGMNTAFAAKLLAQWAGIDEAGIGYAGLKDRHAVTVQRFSVHLPKKVAPDIATLESDELRVLDHAWHAKKLPRGALAQHPVDQVLQHRNAAVRMQALAMDDAHATMAGLTRLGHEHAQHGLGASRIGGMQVEFVLGRVLAAPQSLQDPSGNLVAAVGQRIADFERVACHGPAELAQGLGLVARRHPRQRAWRCLAWRFRRRRQFAHGTDRLAEQGGIVQIVVFALSHAPSLARHPLSFLHARTGQQR